MDDFDITLEEAVDYVNHGLSKYVTVYSGNTYGQSNSSNGNKTSVYSGSSFGYGSQRTRPCYMDSVALKEMVRDGRLPCKRVGENWYFRQADLKPIRKSNDVKRALYTLFSVIVVVAFLAIMFFAFYKFYDAVMI